MLAVVDVTLLAIAVLCSTQLLTAATQEPVPCESSAGSPAAPTPGDRS
jgi:hypothetical protein